MGFFGAPPLALHKGLRARGTAGALVACRGAKSPVQHRTVNAYVCRGASPAARGYQ
jgi:hypothetical protein